MCGRQGNFEQVLGQDNHITNEFNSPGAGNCGDAEVDL